MGKILTPKKFEQLLKRYFQRNQSKHHRRGGNWWYLNFNEEGVLGHVHIIPGMSEAYFLYAQHGDILWAPSFGWELSVSSISSRWSPKVLVFGLRSKRFHWSVQLVATSWIYFYEAEYKVVHVD